LGNSYIYYILNKKNKNKKTTEEKMERTNKVYVVGILRDDFEIREGDKDGQEYIGGNFKVEVEEDNLIEFKFFSYRNTVAGARNKRYDNFKNIPNLAGQRVRINGELAGRAFYLASQGQTISFNEVSPNFINIARNEDENVATFEISGFVFTPLVERADKEDNIVSYDLEVGQANYSGEKMQLLRFNIEPSAKNIISSVREHYTKHSTIRFNGVIHYTPITETKTEEVEFGEAITKTFTSVRKQYLITGGKSPILTGEAYTAEQIEKLTESYRDFLLSVEENAKNSVEVGETVSTPKEAKKSNVDSLI
jgi:hypothetical protein